MSSGVRPKLRSRSSSTSLSQRRIRCFAGSSLARTSLRTRLDRALRHLAGPFAILCCGLSIAMIPFCFRNREWRCSGDARIELASSEHDRQVGWSHEQSTADFRGLRITTSLLPARIGLQP
jgi:hypothetical protein